MPDTPQMEVLGLGVQFPGVRALHDVNLAFLPGEVHGIIGENGAGKSTLMRVLAGLQLPTAGELRIQGRPVRLRSAWQAEHEGIVMVHQELNLVEGLTVAENVFLGREPRKGLRLDRVRMVEKTAQLLEKVGAPFHATDLIDRLSVAERQQVEIAKALAHDVRVLILDEPTAVLSARETTRLFEIVRELRDQGVTVLYISHLLPDLFAVCDRVSVLRDGEHVETLSISDATPERLVNRMVGRELGDFFPPKSPHPSEPENALAIPDYGIRISAGEVVGIAGLVGSGRTELAEAVVGLRTPVKIIRSGNTSKMRRLQDALRAGIAYVSEDRKGCGLVLSMSVSENINLAALSGFRRAASAERAVSQRWIDRLRIRVSDPGLPVSTLSGGNQQKVALAKWLERQPLVLILDEPTRGVDVGAKREIYGIIHELAAEGLACLVISSEMNELIGLCHRVIVLREGKVAGELAEAELSEASIMRLAAGVA